MAEYNISVSRLTELHSRFTSNKVLECKLNITVTVCDRGGGSRAWDVTLINFFIIHTEPEI